MERADGNRGFGPFPADWGLPPGSTFSPVRASWIRSMVRQRSPWSPQDVVDWLARRQYDRGYQSRTGRDGT